MDVLCSFASFLLILIHSCQVFGFQKTQEGCNAPLGLQNGHIPDSHLSASSYYTLFTGSEHVDMKAKYSRLNHQYAWCTNQGKRAQSWLMVDLGTLSSVTGISTQGYAGVRDYYVKSFKLAYSTNGTAWKFVGKAGIDTVFVGNKHGLDVKNNSFDQIQARYIKVFPVSFYIRICLRMELYGCVKGSSIPTTHTPTTTTLTTPPIATSKITSSTRKTTTTSTITPTSIAMITSAITKATSIRSTASSSVGPSISSKSPSVSPSISSKPPSAATSSYTTGIPRYHPTTTAKSSPSLPATSLFHPSKENSTVAMTTFKPSEGATSIATLDAMHQKSVSEEEKKKKDFIIAGFSIFAGLVLLVVLPLLIFLILRRRKRKYSNVQSQLGLRKYSHNRLADCNESFVALDNIDDTKLIEV